jgi:hypothetical protein
VHMSANVINSTVVLNSGMLGVVPEDWQDKMNDVLDSAYTYGREGISKMVMCLNITMNTVGLLFAYCGLHEFYFILSVYIVPFVLRPWWDRGSAQCFYIYSYCLTQILDYSCNFLIYRCFFTIKRKCCQRFLRSGFLSLCRYVV